MASMNKNTNKTTSTASTAKNFPNEEPKVAVYNVTTPKEEMKTMQGLNITGNIRVWKKTFTSMRESRIAYSVSISHKNQNGEYDKCYIPVYFASNARPSADMQDGGYDITIKNAFMTCTKKGDGFIPAIMITDWE